MRQTIKLGRGTFNQLGKYFDAKTKRVLIVCGKSFFKNKNNMKVIESLSNKYKIYFFSDFTPNPKIQDAIKGAQFLHRNQCNIIVAIGGGSSIDMAKLISVAHKYNKNFSLIARGKMKVSGKCMKLIAVPTTAGTGSESTHFSVVYIKEKKFSLASVYLLPSVAIIDPNLAMTTPQYVSACSAFDALSQAIESYWSVNSNIKSRKLSLKAMRIILKNIHKSVVNRNKLSTTKLMIAANYAGQAINITKTTAPHALSYKISSLTNIAHGHAVAITLGKFFVINHYSEKLNNKITKKIQLNRMYNIYKIFGVYSPEDAEREWYRIMKNCGLQSDLRKLKINKPDIIDKIIKSVNIERLNNHPNILSQNEFKKIFEK